MSDPLIMNDPVWASNPNVTFLSAYVTRSHLICGTASGSLMIYSLPGLIPSSSLELHSGAIFSIFASSDSSFIITAGRDHKLKAVKNMKLKDSETILDQPITCFAYNNSVLAYAGLDKFVYLKNTQSHSAAKILQKFPKKICILRLSTDGEWLITSSHEPKFTLVNIISNEQIHLDPEGGEITNLEFCSNNKCIVSTCLQGELILWSIKARQILHKTKAGFSSIQSLSVCENFMIVITNNIVQQWSLTLNLSQKFEFFNPNIALISSDQQQIIVFENRKIIKTVDLEKKINERIWTAPAVTETCRLVKDDLIITGGIDGLIRGWDSKNAEWKFVICTHKQPVKSLASRGEILVSNSIESEVNIVKYSNTDSTFSMSRKMRVLLLSKKKAKLV